jgi:predicted transposase/invertase (TIGR01784 family)
MNIMKNSMDRASFLYNGGKAEGKEEGKAEANLETARKMKSAGLSFSKIEEFTGLSSDTINKL